MTMCGAMLGRGPARCVRERDHEGYHEWTRVPRPRTAAGQSLMEWAHRWTSFSFTEADERQLARMILDIESGSSDPEAVDADRCGTCRHVRASHSAFGMCSGEGTECYCVRFPDAPDFLPDPEAVGLDAALAFLRKRLVGTPPNVDMEDAWMADLLNEAERVGRAALLSDSLANRSNEDKARLASETSERGLGQS